MNYSFPKKQHLAQRETIAALASRGKVVFKYPIKAYWLPRLDDGAALAGDGGGAADNGTALAGNGGGTVKTVAAPLCPRYVFSVPKKTFKRAVKRNLLKRRMREAVRLCQGEILGNHAADYLLVYIAKDICDYAVIEGAVREILSKSKA